LRVWDAVFRADPRLPLRRAQDRPFGPPYADRRSILYGPALRMDEGRAPTPGVEAQRGAIAHEVVRVMNNPRRDGHGAKEVLLIDLICPELLR
jgi:hypothetical protein